MILRNVIKPLFLGVCEGGGMFWEQIYILLYLFISGNNWGL